MTTPLFLRNPRNVFLFDGFGAIVSAMMVGVVLVILNEFIGMPVRVLYLMAGLAASYAIYSLSCYFFFPENWRSFMKGIAGLNLLYCLVSIFFVVSHFESLTQLGVAYFVVEKIILILIVRLEVKTATS